MSRRRSNLKEPLPIYLAYFTAWEENGALKTVPDVYGRDRRHDRGCRIPMTYARHALVVFARVVGCRTRCGHAPEEIRHEDRVVRRSAITDETSAYRDTSVVVLPGAVVVFNAVGGPPGDYAMTTNDGTLVQKGLRQWRWSAPRIAPAPTS